MYLCATRFFWHDYKIYEQNDIFQMTIPMTFLKLFKDKLFKKIFMLFFSESQEGTISSN